MARCVCNSNALLVGDYPAALSHCSEMIDFLRATLSHVPLHPLLTLQEFTLGDLMRECGGRKNEAEEVFAEVVRKMEITHLGTDLLRQAEETLGAIRAGE